MQQDDLGALNLYGASGTEFGDDERIIGEVFATHAALALSEARQSRQMNEALASRDAIGQAKGLLMAQEDLTGQQAFDMLVRASQHANIKLTEVARWVINQHEHPENAPVPRAPDPLRNPSARAASSMAVPIRAWSAANEMGREGSRSARLV